MNILYIKWYHNRVWTAMSMIWCNMTMNMYIDNAHQHEYESHDEYEHIICCTTIWIWTWSDLIWYSGGEEELPEGGGPRHGGPIHTCMHMYIDVYTYIYIYIYIYM